MYMYIHVHCRMHGPLAKLVVEEKKKETQTQYTIPKPFKHVSYICGHLHMYMYMYMYIHVQVQMYNVCTLTVVSVVRGVYPVIK